MLHWDIIRTNGNPLYSMPHSLWDTPIFMLDDNLCTDVREEIYRLLCQSRRLVDGIFGMPVDGRDRIIDQDDTARSW